MKTKQKKVIRKITKKVKKESNKKNILFFGIKPVQNPPSPG